MDSTSNDASRVEGLEAGPAVAGHVPGPWMARLESTRYVIQHAPEDSLGLKAIAVTAGSYPLSEANARLIAAAPGVGAAMAGDWSKPLTMAWHA